jgi:alkylation response protein AidB-like acyl-CoA dehydrogenase
LEPSADWNPEAVQLKAERNGGNFRLNGRKEYVTDADVADVILVVARSGDDLVILPVSRNAEGVTVTLTPSIDATRKLYSIDFANVVIPEGDALETGYRVKEALDAATGIATVALCAEMTGAMQWTLDTTVEYAKTRLQFDKPIGIYQAVQHKCAEMVLYTESARSSVYYAAWALSENDPSAKLAVSMAKAYCSDSARETGNRGIQLHGGIGFTWEHNLHLYYKRAKSSEVMFGDATYHRELIAKEVVDELEK